MKNNRIGVGTAIALSLICVSVGCSAAQDDAAFTQGTEEVTQQAIFSDRSDPSAAVSSANPLEAYLLWDTAPDKVSVRFWNEECWNNPTAGSEEIPVNITDTDLNTPTFSIELKDGNCIYEVVAEWNSSEKYGGTAYYSFYTVKPDMEPQPVD